MKVKELIAALKKYPPTHEVILSCNTSGDISSLIDDLEEVRYVSFVDGSCEIYIKELTEDMQREGFCKEDFGENKEAEGCVIIWPKY